MQAPAWDRNLAMLAPGGAGEAHIDSGENEGRKERKEMKEEWNGMVDGVDGNGWKNEGIDHKGMNEGGIKEWMDLDLKWLDRKEWNGMDLKKKWKGGGGSRNRKTGLN